MRVDTNVKYRILPNTHAPLTNDAGDIVFEGFVSKLKVSSTESLLLVTIIVCKVIKKEKKILARSQFWKLYK